MIIKKENANLSLLSNDLLDSKAPLTSEEGKIKVFK